MRRFTRLLALLLVLALVGAACGGDDDDDDGAVDAGDDTETTEADAGDDGAADLSGETVSVAAVWGGAEQESFEAVLDGFEEATGATTEFQSTGDDIAAVLGTAIEGGNPPDVAVLPQPGLLSDLADGGSLVEIEDVAGDLVDENYAPVWRELGSVDGTLYGVWFKAANKSTVWFSTEAWQTAGLAAGGGGGDTGAHAQAADSMPSTWGELIAAAETLRDSGVTPFAIAGADGWTLTDWFENVYLNQAGGELYDQLTNHEIPWTHDSVKAALGTLAELFGGEGLINDDAASTDFPTSVTKVFAEGTAATVYEGDFVAGVIAEETDAALGEDADFFAFPSVGDGDGAAVVGGGDVAVLLRESEAGEELMRYLASPEAAEIWAARGGFTSPNQAVDTSVYPDDITRRSAELLAGASTFRFDLSDLQPSEFGGTVGQGLFKQFQDFLTNPSDIDGVTEAMETSASEAFG